MCAAIHHRRQLQDLADRRIRTAELRTVCTYIAATLQLAEGAENVLLSEAQNLSLGTGTEPPATSPGNVAGHGGGVGLLPQHERLDGEPDSVAIGEPSPIPAGIDPAPLGRLAGILGGQP